MRWCLPRWSALSRPDRPRPECTAVCPTAGTCTTSRSRCSTPRPTSASPTRGSRRRSRNLALPDRRSCWNRSRSPTPSLMARISSSGGWRPIRSIFVSNGPARRRPQKPSSTTGTISPTRADRSKRRSERQTKMHIKYLAGSVALFAGLLALGWITHGTSIVQNDPERNIFIPEDLTSELQVKATYDGTNIWFRYRWPAERPMLFNDVLVYQDGAWEERGGEVMGPDPDNLVEDRVAMMVDDGAVPLFGRYGGYITIGEGLTTFTGVPETEEERSKYLPSTRTDPNDFETIKPETDLEALRAAGQFIDLWDWKSSRTNPLGQADDTSVGAEREDDAGTAPYFVNFNEDTGQPLFMFDPAKGDPALKIDAVMAGDVGFNDSYYLTEASAVPFDPNRQWQNGDTLPRQILRQGAGSRADIAMPAAARWRNGFWDVTLVRKMDTGNPLEDKIFREGGSYDLAFAVFRKASTMRWHYVSLPVSLGLEQPAQMVAERIEPGTEPDWTQPWTEIKTYYPGQVTWGRLTDARQHPGADRIAQRVPVAYRHGEEQLALYGIEMEFAKEIRTQWLWTLFISLGLIVGMGININLLMRRREAAK
ncbi:MAG: hypothetical protein C0524_12925 [Rhodobacter sp.]|nr:hypothetical protein [Rhodobacter sp.]